MKSVGIRELKRDATKIMRAVREEGASYEVTYRGRTIARIVPVATIDRDEISNEDFWDGWERLAREIGEEWHEGVSAVDIVREGRRDLS